MAHFYNTFDSNVSKRTVLGRVFSTGVISSSIGFIFLYLSCPECVSNPKTVWLNVCYSLLLGYGLFSYGFMFGWIERRYISWINHPLKSIILVFLFSTFYCGAVILGVNWFWHSVIEGVSFSHFVKHYGFVMWIEFGIFYFIALWFYARSFFLEWRREVENRERLKREALMLQYETLKTQVNPHFLFNSLNSLISLMDINIDSAKQFTSELSRFYRDILYLKGKELIPLNEEVDILKRYMYLQQIRFGEKFSFELNIDSSVSAMVIPLSVQMLAENIFKHNVISGDEKLKIKLGIAESNLVISNSYLPKPDPEESTGLGLSNLRERILYLTGKELVVKESENEFTVVLPLVFIDNENITG
ncbi:sensor histidine kinase [Carboxylicivirga sp. N1Y90]|uniref:sensor histidine kinase n=1 Tax=Carboxylicivirga fragile TaxID=3417571 RepID=UPI003D357CBB|nr:histidine kinase [Marinilabiliaceae bacterium N1Y90]